MDVRCERCRAQYVFDDEQVTPAGLAVQCTNCGHAFRVKKKELVVTVPLKPGELQGTPLPAVAASPRPSAGPPAPPLQASPPVGPEPERPREWRVRQRGGNVFTFRELTTLQKWIVEQKVFRDDEIARAGEQWRRLGEISELASFFEVVEAAERSRILALPGAVPQASAAVPSVPNAGPRQLLPPPVHEVDLGLDEDLASPPRRSGGTRLGWAMGLLFALGGAGAAAFLHPASPLRARPLAPAGARDPALAPGSGPHAGIAGSDRPGAARPESPPAPLAAAGSAPESASPTGAAGGPHRAGEPSGVPPAAAALAAAASPAAAAAGSGREGAGDGPEPGADAAPQSVPGPAADAAAAAPERAGPRVMLAQARKLRERGELGAALELYDRLVAYDPGNADALIGRGLCYLDLERYLPAEASFEAALRIEPHHPDALLGLAETYRFEGKRPEAVRQYERYLAEHPAGEEADVARNAIEELRE